jgi:hypothetical protein
MDGERLSETPAGPARPARGPAAAGDELQAIVAEARKTRETADRMANGEHPGEADEVRVLAGMVRQVADQIERLAERLTGQSGAGLPDRQELDRLAEEDASPQDAPAEPARTVRSGAQEL